MQSALAIVATASSVFGVATVSALAQSDTRVSREAAIVQHAPMPALQVYSGEHAAAAAEIGLPPNLTFPELLRPTIVKMLERSATFRRQCLRIAQSPQLLIRLSAPPQYGPVVGARARTQIGATADGRLVANITITVLRDVVELIGHEFEHVLEQLDGIDLRSRSSRSGSGVWMCADGTIETVRAVHVGRSVADEAGRRP